MSVRMAMAAILLAAGSVAPALAGAPMAKTQPGYYRMMLGDFEITALNDGVVFYPTSQAVPKLPADQIKRSLSESGLTDPVGMSYDAYLVNTGNKLVLIDTGTGGKLDNVPSFHGAGRLMANLRAAGYQPEQVDEIYITHGGPDHIGGLTTGNKRAFPNALVRVPKGEFEKFLDPEQSKALLTQANNSPQAKALIDMIKDLFTPYIEAGKYQTIDEDGTLTPGIRAVATHGHTPGHTSYIVENGGQTLIVMGDLVHIAALQLADPSLSTAFDADPKAAGEQRLRMLKMAADKDYWVADSHISFPGIGHVRFVQDHYRWEPINYAIP